MSQFYEGWRNIVNYQPVAGEIKWSGFLRVSFSHHMEIINKCKSLEERNEPLLDKRISDNIRDFILRFGQDFMFILRNYRLIYGEEEKLVVNLVENYHIVNNQNGRVLL